MFKHEITFDRFVRGLLLFLGIVAAYFLLDYLGGVLLPFFVAWLAACLLYPIVAFLQYKCRLGNRLLCILLTLLLVVGGIGGLAYLGVPPMLEELGHLKDATLRYIEKGADNSTIPQMIQHFFRENADKLKLDRLLRNEDVVAAVKSTFPKVWGVLWSTANVIVNFLSSLIGLLYLFFLLMDYEKYAKGWIKYVPHHRREFAARLVEDIERGMSGYFRGQALIALSNCVMFSVGFLLIGFPMPVGLGVFIGIISFVPYLQVAGILPAIVLALIRASETGDNFWWLIGSVLLVYLVVQIIQDVVVTPHVMGKIMNLSPAIILLSLSVWGYMFGIFGLVVALPATTLAISYYKRYVIGCPPAE